MSEKTEARPPQNSEEVNEWVEETKKEAAFLHEKLENLQVAKELGLFTKEGGKKWQ